MGLERFDPMDHNPLQYDGMMVPRADGEYYRADDVDALLARIRDLWADLWVALEEERRQWDIAATGGGITGEEQTDAAGAALDALLKGGE